MDLNIFKNLFEHYEISLYEQWKIDLPSRNYYDFLRCPGPA